MLPVLLSFSLTNLISQCQKHIFCSVRLWLLSNVCTSARRPSQETLKYDRQARLFVRAVAPNPTLRQVRKLDHRVTSEPDNDDCDLDILLFAIEMMPNIDDFTLASRDADPLRQAISVSASYRSYPRR